MTIPVGEPGDSFIDCSRNGSFEPFGLLLFCERLDASVELTRPDRLLLRSSAGPDQGCHSCQQPDTRRIHWATVFQGPGPPGITMHHRHLLIGNEGAGRKGRGFKPGMVIDAVHVQVTRQDGIDQRENPGHPCVAGVRSGAPAGVDFVSQVKADDVVMIFDDLGELANE